MLKIDEMVLSIKMDRSINTDNHYISPGGYELLFSNGESVAFDFYTSVCNIDKNEDSVINCHLFDLDTDDFENADRLISNLLCSQVKEIVECFIYTGEEDGKDEINPVSIMEWCFVIVDIDKDTTTTIEIGKHILANYHFD